MEEQITKGRNLVVTILAFIIGESLINIIMSIIYVENVGGERLTSELIGLAVTLLFAYFLYRGRTWARWLTAISMLFSAIAYLLRAFEGFFVPGAFSLWVVFITLMAIINGVFGILLLTSRDIKAFMESQRGIAADR